MKILPVGAELFRADEWKGVQDEANIAFRSFVNAPKKTLYGMQQHKIY